MIASMALVMSAQRRAQSEGNGQRVSRSLMIASGLAIAVFLLLWVVWPRTEQQIVKVVLPEPHREVVLRMPAPMPPAPASQATVRQFAVRELPDGIVNEPTPVAPARRRAPEVDPDAGKLGRQRAEQATQELARATSALDKNLGALSNALAATGDQGEPVGRRRGRSVGGGRSDGQLAGYESRLASSGAGSDLAGSGVAGQMVAIGSLQASDVDRGGGGGGGDPRSSGAAPGIYRSNASLLAVIQKYAAGIQYCYGNELKRDPTLKGKLVVAITVAASGAVTEVSVVRNTVGSARLESCALSQIHDWKFPAIAEGSTTFQAPFVFTPPN